MLINICGHFVNCKEKKTKMKTALIMEIVDIHSVHLRILCETI